MSRATDIRELLTKDNIYIVLCLVPPNTVVFSLREFFADGKNLGCRRSEFRSLLISLEWCWANFLLFLCLHCLNCKMGMTISDWGCSRRLSSEEGKMIFLQLYLTLCHLLLKELWKYSESTTSKDKAVSSTYKKRAVPEARGREITWGPSTVVFFLPFWPNKIPALSSSLIVKQKPPCISTDAHKFPRRKERKTYNILCLSTVGQDVLTLYKTLSPTP